MCKILSSFLVINYIGSPPLVVACDSSPCGGPTLNKIFQILPLGPKTNVYMSRPIEEFCLNQHGVTCCKNPHSLSLVTTSVPEERLK